ncbi:MAG TPA: 3-oxoacyl-[acyl-carrier-protein] synthase III C-terminal domain-containing protein [Myxococcota bacterium]|nr:3-oxoacyl-[acyl-carrier-protein] synthase III C-terminal domain-containing protein [Myxococcota bacterium]
MRIASVGCALPANVYEQEELRRALAELWAGRFRNARRIEQIHRNVQVERRHLALTLDAYRALRGFGDANDAWIRCALELSERAIREALARAELHVADVDHVFSTSVTGIAVPSLDARLANRLGLRSDVKRTPIFGLGCVGGAASIARAADYLRAFPRHNALVLAVELCSLTLQRADASLANVIASGLFGDGAACAVLRGAEVASRGPRVVASRSIFYRDTEHVMGWELGDGGFKIVLSADVPALAAGLRPDADKFLAENGLTLADIDLFLCHPGGPKVLEAIESSLALPREALARSWRHLSRVGNLSSASVLFVLADALAEEPPPGARGLLFAMGPGFCSELVLLAW